MAIEIKVPALPESVADAVILDWHKQVGEPVRRDDNLVDLETDKIVLEVPAPADGVLTSISAKSGSTVEDGDLLAIFTKQSIEAQSESTATPAAPASAGDEPKTGPAVRKQLNEQGLSASDVVGSGKDGRILKEDVVAHSDSTVTADVEKPTSPAISEQPIAAAPATSTDTGGLREESREPMSRIRQTIANRLVNAQQSTAMLTTFNEVDMSAVMAMRSKYKELFAAQHDSKLGFMSFFVKASVAALQQFPLINAYIDGTDVVHSTYNDVGIAVSSPRGLVVPIIRDAQNLGFAQIENTIRDFGGRAQSGKLGLDDLTGGTFTITNGGIFGSLLSTPILNPPQSAILGMHSIQQRPMAVDGEVVVRPMMYLALSYDHRIVDGKDAVQFLVSIKNSLEDPARMLLEIR